LHVIIDDIQHDECQHQLNPSLSQNGLGTARGEQNPLDGLAAAIALFPSEKPNIVGGGLSAPIPDWELQAAAKRGDKQQF
jgi:hypothetical protein